ncbi:zinc ribbon domain-containing protein [Staphylococcus xylosus]|uniref:zinc ribbon domain-containing protein n=1 Tax=Staphylococcus xylosus TaxID=1288 RepID=UPI00369C5D6B
MYGNLVIDDVIRFISKEITERDKKNIKLHEDNIENYCNNPIDIIDAKYRNVKIIYDYIQNTNREEVEYLGIDLGTKTFMTCSDANINHAFTIKNEKIEMAINKYINKATNKELSINEVTEKFKKQIEEPISSSIKLLTKKYKTDTTYVIGLPHIHTTTSEFYILASEVIGLFRKYSKKYGYRIHYVYEYNTSITCPRCNDIDKNNRKKNNKFKCKKCGFQHWNDHEVAASNIVNRYLSEHKA